MRVAILAEAYSARDWLTTADLARALERTRSGALWIVKQADVPCDRTTLGYRLFRQRDVLRLVQHRADARLRRVTALRPKKLGVPGEPQQLALALFR